MHGGGGGGISGVGRKEAKWLTCLVCGGLVAWGGRPT